jgi:hypothetical protein
VWAIGGAEAHNTDGGPIAVLLRTFSAVLVRFCSNSLPRLPHFLSWDQSPCLIVLDKTEFKHQNPAPAPVEHLNFESRPVDLPFGGCLEQARSLDAELSHHSTALR